MFPVLEGWYAYNRAMYKLGLYGNSPSISLDLRRPNEF